SALTIAERIVKKSDLKKTLSYAHAVLCSDAAAASKLQQAADFPVLPPAAALKTARELLTAEKDEAIGAILLPEAGKNAGGILKHIKEDVKIFRARSAAEMSTLISGKKNIGRWLVLCRPFNCAPEVPQRLLFLSDLFRDAGALMPAVLRPTKLGGAMQNSQILAEAFALSRRGLFREPFYIHEPTVLCIRRQCFIKTGGIDARFKSLDYALTDLCLRMYQAGHRSIVAEDLSVFSSAPRQTVGALKAEEKEILVRKWGMESLKFMELLVSELHANS
ncbi:MAG TPA: hypothetical protein PLL10_09235, partial [Elusimicrobiales bacterium]|nr:hypothetical protein [Elusimicrobiales bacterium]